MYYLFYELIFNQLFANAYPLDEFTFELMGRPTDLCEYASSLLALICTIIVYVVVCLLCYKVIKLFGRLLSTH